jgi:hypothetical protein
MKKIAVLAFVASFISPACAENSGPWFGSEATPPEQISLTQADIQTSPGAMVSDAGKILCPIEGCPLPQKLGKEEQ